MKEIYTLHTKLMNGTVTMSIMSSNYASEELARKTKKALDERNDEHIITDIQKTILYEDESEVPILREQKNETDRENI